MNTVVVFCTLLVSIIITSNSFFYGVYYAKDESVLDFIHLAHNVSFLVTITTSTKGIERMVCNTIIPFNDTTKFPFLVPCRRHVTTWAVSQTMSVTFKSHHHLKAGNPTISYHYKYPYCHTHSMNSSAFHGLWLYENKIVTEHDILNECPKYWKERMTSTSQLFELDRNHLKYAIPGYHIAHYNGRENCQILSLDESITRFLLQHNPSFNYSCNPSSACDEIGIVFLGDSLTLQIYDAAQCYLESLPQYLRQHVRLHYIQDPYLRGDFPCTSLCSSKTKLTNDTRWQSQHVCNACDSNGNKKNMSMMSFHDRFPWVKKIPKNTRIILMNSGAWYSLMKGFIRSKAEYQLMLNYIIEALHYIKRAGLSIYWHELPPSITTTKVKKEWEWKKFEEKNELVRKILLPTNTINILYTSNLLLPRKVFDARNNVSYDGLHWSCPGRYSVPLFIFKLLMHAIATTTTEA